MCGIVGYVGQKQARDVVIEGLRRLEYRGYDSAGIALVDGGDVAWRKRAGKLANLEKALADDPLPLSTTSSPSSTATPAESYPRYSSRRRPSSTTSSACFDPT